MESKSRSSAAMVTASASKKGPMRHKFARIEILPAKNGYTMKHHPPAEEGSRRKEMGWTPPPEPEEMVFNDSQELLDHIGGILGGGNAPGNKSDKTASGKMDGADKKDIGKNEGKEDEENDED